MIESIDVIYETRFSSIPKPNDLIPTTMTPSNGQEHGDIVAVRSSKRIRKEKSFRSDFFVYLIEENRDSIDNKIYYIYSTNLDPNSFKEAMDSHMILLSEKK